MENGEISTWERDSLGWETNPDGSADMSKPPKAAVWYDKYLGKYLNTVKVDYDNTYEGRVMAYFSDGSLMLYGINSIIFYPEAKNYTIVNLGEDNFSRDKTDSGIKYFTFAVYKNGIEPYVYGSFDGSREMLLTDPTLGCQQKVTNERAYCTKLIQMNGWHIPEDYPFKF